MIAAIISVPPVELLEANTMPRPTPQPIAPTRIDIVSLARRASVIYRSAMLRIMVSAIELNSVLITYFRPTKNHAKTSKKELRVINDAQRGIPVEYLINSDTPPNPPVTTLKGMRNPVRLIA